MATNVSSLVAELTGANAATYATPLQTGDCTPVFQALALPHASQVMAVVAPSMDVLNAAAPGIKTLTATQLARLQVLLAPGVVNFGDSDTVNELKDIFAGQAAVLQRLAAIGKRPKTIAEAASIVNLTVEECRLAMEQVVGSFYNTLSIAPQVSQLDISPGNQPGSWDVLLTTLRAQSVAWAAAGNLKTGDSEPDASKVTPVALVNGVLRVPDALTGINPGGVVILTAIAFTGPNGTGTASLQQRRRRLAE